MKTTKTTVSRIAQAATVMTGLAAITPAHAWHVSLNLQASNGMFVAAEGGGGGALNANRSTASIWETFTLIDHDAGQLMSGDLVSFRTFNGAFVVAENGGGGVVQANRAVPGPWETFTIVKLSNTTTPISDGDSIALRSVGGNHLTAENGGGSTVVANRTTPPAAWETFRVRFRGSPAGLTLSSPFTLPAAVSPVVLGVDRSTTASTNPVYTCANHLGLGVPGCYGGHTGTDFGFTGGFPGMDLGSINVVAAAPGRVVQVADGNVDRCQLTVPLPPANSPPAAFVTCPGVGGAQVPNFVAILQDDGRVAYYFHLARGSTAVVVGARVACGQLIGKVGSSGTSTMPHLHFELRAPSALQVSSGVTLPRHRSEFDFPNASTVLGVIDPYGPPSAWAGLIGAIPTGICTHPSSDNNFSPGERCGDLDRCGPGQACDDDDLCHAVGVPPGGSCDGLHHCGTGLNCVGGRCTPGCTAQCLAPCRTSAGGGCVVETPTIRQQSCTTLPGVCNLPCYQTGSGACVVDVPSTTTVSCAPLCLP